MKYVIIIGDGMSDRVGKGKTPLEAARTPNLDLIARQGMCGMCKTLPPDLPAGSDVAYLSILGFDPHKYYTGRAPLEAASLGIPLSAEDVAFRCNLVKIENDIMADYSAGHIKTEEAQDIIELLNEDLGSENVTFYPGVSYRHIAVIKNGPLNLQCTPPHDISGKNIESYLPKGEGEEFIRSLMEVSRKVLKGKKYKTNMIWLWGQGKTPNLPTFQQKFGLKGSVITAVDLIKGLGKLLGLAVIQVPGATGYIDTNYVGKGLEAIESLKENDFVLIHVEAIDEASHMGDLKTKISAIEDFDRLTVGSVLEGIKQFDEFRILLMPDHATPVALKTHTHDPVPFAIYGSGIPADAIQHFNEKEIAKSPLLVEDGYTLIDRFIYKEMTKSQHQMSNE